MIDPRKLYHLLKHKNINQLYHANSVATSITFLESGGLLSRGAVSNRHSYQTSQQSDWSDRRFGVWDDIFLDMHDLHSKFERQNYYGPVVFRFSTDFLLTTKYELRITKSNPADWKPGEKRSDRYFKNVEELNDKWNNYDHQKKMITLRNNVRPALFNHLEAIILDLPGQSEYYMRTYNSALKSLREARRSRGLLIRIKKRVCNGCYCEENYSKYSKFRLSKMFSSD